MGPSFCLSPVALFVLIQRKSVNHVLLGTLAIDTITGVQGFVVHNDFLQRLITKECFILSCTPRYLRTGLTLLSKKYKDFKKYFQNKKNQIIDTTVLFGSMSWLHC